MCVVIKMAPSPVPLAAKLCNTSNIALKVIAKTQYELFLLNNMVGNVIVQVLVTLAALSLVEQTFVCSFVKC